MDTIEIRPMSPEDWPSVSEIYKQGLETNAATFETVCPSYEKWDEAHLPQCRIVATDAGCVVGWAVLSPMSRRLVYAGVGELSLYVDQGFKKRGIGTTLLDALCKLTEDSGFWTLQATIIEGNTGSIRLHEKYGFRVVGYREKIAKDKFGVWKNTIIMERRSAKL